jgi:hypothetical protein
MKDDLSVALKLYSSTNETCARHGILECFYGAAFASHSRAQPRFQ